MAELMAKDLADLEAAFVDPNFIPVMRVILPQLIAAVKERDALRAVATRAWEEWDNWLSEVSADKEALRVAMENLYVAFTANYGVANTKVADTVVKSPHTKLFGAGDSVRVVNPGMKDDGMRGEVVTSGPDGAWVRGVWTSITWFDNEKLCLVDAAGVTGTAEGVKSHG